MSRTSPPCSSSAPRDRAPARPEWRARRRARPSLQSPQPGSREAYRPHAFLEIRGTGSYAFLNECHEIRRDRRLSLAPHRHAAPILFDHDLLARLVLVRVGIVAPRMSTPTLGPLQTGPRGRLRHGEQRTEVDGGVPAGIVFAASGHADFARARLELLQLGERVLEAGLVTDDPGVALHHSLERRLHGIWILALPFERLERL